VSRVEILGGHVVDVIRRELSDFEQIDIAATLAGQGIPVVPVVDIFHTLHLWPQAPLSTAAADQAIRAFKAVTDCRIDYHDPRPPVAPSCLLCQAEGGRLTHGLCDGCRATFDQAVA
jgi:hypothetical protein